MNSSIDEGQIDSHSGTKSHIQVDLNIAQWNQDRERNRIADVKALQNEQDEILSFDKESESTLNNLNTMQAELQSEIDKTMVYSEEDALSIGG